MQIKTNMRGSFAEDLRDLMEKHDVIGADGWDDGSVYLTVKGQAGVEYWVEFVREDE